LNGIENLTTSIYKVYKVSVVEAQCFRSKGTSNLLQIKSSGKTNLITTKQTKSLP